MMKQLSRYIRIFPILSLSLLLAACGPSDEKVSEAQEKYAVLADKHNELVAAHEAVDNSSYDSALSDLQEKLTTLQSYNLEEMTDEEIDSLIASMDDLIDSYEDYLVQLSDTREEEEAAVLTSIPLSLTNNSALSFSTVSLYEKGTTTARVNILSGMSALLPGQSLTGLVIERDVDRTPWMIYVETADGTNYEAELPVDSYTEEGVSLSLTVDAEADALIAK